MLKHILAGVALILMLTGGAAAGPFEEGADTFERGDYTTALRLWRPLADQGDVKAQTALSQGRRHDQTTVGQDCFCWGRYTRSAVRYDPLPAASPRGTKVKR